MSLVNSSSKAKGCDLTLNLVCFVGQSGTGFPIDWVVSNMFDRFPLSEQSTIDPGDILITDSLMSVS